MPKIQFVLLFHILLIAVDANNPNFLSKNDFENAGKLTEAQIDRGVGVIKENAEFNPKYFGGDIVDQPKKKRLDVHGYITKSSGRHWPNGRVPYEFVDFFTNEEKVHIAKAFSFFHNKTCIRFVPREAEDKSYLEIMKDSGCFSEELGRLRKRPQEVSLSEDCIRVDIIIHELMHALGFMHEFSRPDRDKYIDIDYENLDSDPSARNQFKKLSGDLFGDWNLTFDIKSAMFYESNMGAKDPNLVVMKARNGEELRCKPHLCPTQLDIVKINTVYNCKKYFNSINMENNRQRCSSLVWKWKKELPLVNNAVVARESNGFKLYVCRAQLTSGQLVSGQTNQQNTECVVQTNQAFTFASTFTNYELLTNHNSLKLEWKALNKNENHNNSVVVDRHSYVSRCNRYQLLFNRFPYCVSTQLLKC